MSRDALVLLSCALLAPASGAQGLSKLSVAPGGTAANDDSTLSVTSDAVSADGRFVVFLSEATNLVAGDTNGKLDAFRHDRATSAIVRVSLGNGGVEPNEPTLDAALSDDGRYVAFQTQATNLVANDAPLTHDIFRRDVLTGATELVSVTTSGGPCDQTAEMPSISADGSRVAFATRSSLYIPFDGNGRRDIFVRDMNSGTTWRVSRIPSGPGPNQDCGNPVISGDGQFVAFESTASNLGAPPGTQHIFLSLVPIGVIEEVSVSGAGVTGDGWSTTPSISHDGSRIAFLSRSTNFEPVGGLSRDLPFVRDRSAGTTRLIARQPNGQPVDGPTPVVRLSTDGRYAGFSSASALLTPGSGGSELDIFLVDVDTLETERVSAPAGGTGEPNAPVVVLGGVSDWGGVTVFSSAANNLLVGDTPDSLSDAFRFERTDTWYLDADGDGFGNASVSITTLPPAPPGHVANAADCDDTNAAVHPGATEVCNGLDDDCDGSSDAGALVRYCVSATSQAGCGPTMSSSGFASASGTSGLTLSASQLPGARQACLTYGFGATQTVLAAGSSSWICVQAPRTRTRPMPTGGSEGTCDGSYALDWLAWMAQNPTALGNPLAFGQTVCAQVWYRDPGAVLNMNLTDAIQFGICP